MAEPAETWSERFEREVEALTRLLRKRPWLAALFLIATGWYGFHNFIAPTLTNKVDTSPPPPVIKSPTVETSVPEPESPTLTGKAAWIYVGSRIDNKWQKSEADEAQPALTLNLIGLPRKGLTYTVMHGVRLRTKTPEEKKDGSRPPMEDSIGTIGAGSIVAVDDVKEIEVLEIEPRTWIWAHITVIEAK